MPRTPDRHLHHRAQPYPNRSSSGRGGIGDSSSPLRHSSSSSPLHRFSSSSPGHRSSSDIFGSPPSSPATARRLALADRARWKREKQELVDTIVKLRAEKKGRAITDKTFGRVIKRVASLFDSVASCVLEGDRRDSDDSPEEVPELTDDELLLLTTEQRRERHESMIEKRRRDRLYEGFLLLCKHVPGFKQSIENPEIDAKDQQKYFALLESGAGGARNDDVSTAKGEVVGYLEARDNPPFPRLSRVSRTGRGFKCDVIGALICPPDLDWNDSAVQVQLKENQISLSASDFAFYLPFLYDTETVDLEDIELGYLMGPLLVKTYKMIFTAPGSVDDFSMDPDPLLTNKRVKNGRLSTKKNVAERINLDAPTPRSIAYAAIILRFQLSDASTWGADRSFNYEGLYNSIVDYFEETDPNSDDGPKVKRLLAWWKKQVFADAESNAATSSKPLEGHKATLQAQRRAAAERRKALAEAAATASGSGSGSGPDVGTGSRATGT